MAWSLAAIAIVLFAVGVSVDTLGSSSLGPHLSTTDIALFAAFLTYALVGAAVASRHPDNAIGWLLLTEGLLLQLVPFSIGFVSFGLYDEARHWDGAALIALVGASVWIPALVVAAFIFLVFPTGHLRSRRWRPVAWVGVALAAVAFGSEIFRPGAMGGSLSDLDNPVGIAGAEDLLSTLGAIATPLAGPLLLGAALLSFALRFREADGTQRQQLHWLAYAALVLV